VVTSDSVAAAGLAPEGWTDLQERDSRPAPAPSAWRGARKNSRLWWRVHQWAGLKFSLFLSFILLTGTLAVLSSEMDWLMRPAMRVNPTTVSGTVDWAAIARNAAAAQPNYRISYMDAPEASAFAATLTVEKPDGSLGFLYAHPTSGAIQGEGHWVGAKRVLRNMHRHLNLPVKYGVPIVCALAFLLAVSLATSLVIYKKWWRGFLRPIRMRDARTAWGDFHRLAGVWSLWFALLMIVTGLWYFAEETALRAPDLPSAQAPALAAAGADLPARLERALTAARAADPALRIEAIRLPDSENGAFVFQGQKTAWLVRARANAVWVGGADARVLLVTDGRDLGVHQRISEMADPLHFGTFGGYWTKLPWFLFGLLLTALSVSGVALYSLRLLRAERVPAAATPLFARAWHGMGWWRWPSIGLVILGLALLPSLFTSG
jgi:uncharacterized iron-regulated membrane protein